METKLKDIVIINKKSYTAKMGWPFLNYLDTGNITENRINQISYYDLPSKDVPSRAKRIVSNGTIVYSTVRPKLRCKLRKFSNRCCFLR